MKAVTSKLREALSKIVHEPSFHNVLGCKVYCRLNDYMSVHKLIVMFEADKKELVEVVKELLHETGLEVV